MTASWWIKMIGIILSLIPHGSTADTWSFNTILLDTQWSLSQQTEMQLHNQGMGVGSTQQHTYPVSVRSHPNSDIQSLISNLQYPISNIQSPSPQLICSAWSPHLFPSHQTLHSPSTFNHAQLYLGNPSIISAYPALITDVTRFSIVPPFVFPES